MRIHRYFQKRYPHGAFAANSSDGFVILTQGIGWIYAVINDAVLAARYVDIAFMLSLLLSSYGVLMGL